MLPQNLPRPPPPLHNPPPKLPPPKFLPPPPPNPLPKPLPPFPLLPPVPHNLTTFRPQPLRPYTPAPPNTVDLTCRLSQNANIQIPTSTITGPTLAAFLPSVRPDPLYSPLVAAMIASTPARIPPS